MQMAEGVPVKRGFSPFFRRDWMGSGCVLDTGKRHESNGYTCPSRNWVMKQNMEVPLVRCKVEKLCEVIQTASHHYADSWKM